MKNIILKTIGIIAITTMILSCDSDEVCGYVGDDDPDCPNIGLDIGDPCDSNQDGSLDGIVNDVCECIPIDEKDCPNLDLNIGDSCDSNQDGSLDGVVTGDCECVPAPVACGEFIQNGDFETTTGDPNAVIDQDIDLATSWGRLWGSNDASLADLFDDTTTSFGSSSFLAPTPTSGVFAGMWIENSNSTNATYREGMFNQMATTILPNTGNYLLRFNYAVMSTDNSNPVKIGVYGVNFNGTLPPAPTGMQTPSNLDLYGSGNSILLGEITVPNGANNTWALSNISFDTDTLTMPATGFTHIMITNSHLPFNDFGRMYIAFDDYCIIQTQ